MILPLIQGTAPQDAIRREIAVGERLLLLAPAASQEAIVAADGRIRLENGERVQAVRHTLPELLQELPRYRSVRRLPARDAGFSILPAGLLLRVDDGTTLLDALKGLKISRVTIFAADDSVKVVERSAFGVRRLVAGDALVLAQDAEVPRATIVGGVLSPGAFDVTEGSTLGSIIDAAKGFAPRALVEQVVIERSKRVLGPYALPRDAAILVLAGDLVRVPVGNSAGYVSIAGAVKRPGLIEVFAQMTVLQAIQAAGGLNQPAEGLVITLKSITDPKRKTVKAKATELSKFPTLKAGDLLEIASPPPRSQ